MKKRKPGRPKEKGGMGNFIKTLLMKPLSYRHIHVETLKRFPNCQVTEQSVRWYAWKLRQEGVKLPARINSRFYLD